jgi:hypothetical protein
VTESLSVPLKPADVPDRIVRLRAYHFVNASEAGEDQVAEITDFTIGKIQQLPRGLKLTWREFQVTPDAAILGFGLDYPDEISATVRDLVMKRFNVFDAEGKPIPIRGHETVYGGEWRLRMSPKVTPAKVVISISPSLHTYGGIMEFRDIPVPPLPPLPE